MAIRIQTARCSRLMLYAVVGIMINPGSVGLPLNRTPGRSLPRSKAWTRKQNPELAGACIRCIPYDRRPALKPTQRPGILEAGGVMTQLS